MRLTYGRTYIQLTLWPYLAKCVYPPDWIMDPETVCMSISVGTRFSKLSVKSSSLFVPFYVLWLFGNCNFNECVYCVWLCSRGGEWKSFLNINFVTLTDWVRRCRCVEGDAKCEYARRLGERSLGNRLRPSSRRSSNHHPRSEPGLLRLFSFQKYNQTADEVKVSPVWR